MESDGIYESFLLMSKWYSSCEVSKIHFLEAELMFPGMFGNLIDGSQNAVQMVL